MKYLNKIKYEIDQLFSFNAIISIDICRIFLSLSVLLSPLFYTDYAFLLENSAEIHPKGIISLLLLFVKNISTNLESAFLRR